MNTSSRRPPLRDRSPLFRAGDVALIAGTVLLLTGYPDASPPMPGNAAVEDADARHAALGACLLEGKCKDGPGRALEPLLAGGARAAHTAQRHASAVAVER